MRNSVRRRHAAYAAPMSVGVRAQRAQAWIERIRLILEHGPTASDIAEAMAMQTRAEPQLSLPYSPIPNPNPPVK